MLSEVYYLIRSKADGRYVSGRPNPDSSENYLLLFSEHFDALSYLNKHAAELASKFSVESISGSQIKPILQRWGFTGIGIIKDPLLPQIEFMVISNQ